MNLDQALTLAVIGSLIGILLAKVRILERKVKQLQERMKAVKHD